MESVTYTVVYTGTAIQPDEPEPTGPFAGFSAHPLIILVPALLLLLLIALAVLLFLRRKNVYVYRPGEKPRDYEVIAKFRVAPESPSVDLSTLEPYPTGTVAIELKRPLTKKLVGREFTVQCKAGAHTYTVLQERPSDWHEFEPNELQEVPL